MKVADKNDELLEIVDDNGNSTGKFEKRDIVHNSQLFHNEIALWVIDKEKKQVLVQRRSKLKKLHPNKIALCAGHVVAGETIVEALEKEAQEEIGINLKDFDVKEVLRIKRQEKNNFCFSYHFAILKYIPIEQFTIQEEELSEVFYMDYEELKQKIKISDSEMAIFWSDEVKLLFDELDKIIY
ncbi:MAG: NUDIX domain-containing protein [Clostridia bacterium]|nr:NUDIX domain-containing protein [Clostridia bacterium]